MQKLKSEKANQKDLGKKGKSEEGKEGTHIQNGGVLERRQGEEGQVSLETPKKGLLNFCFCATDLFGSMVKSRNPFSEQGF